MYYIVETDKSFEQAVTDLDASVKNHKFGVLHIHDIGGTLRNKGVEFSEECKIFEVCNPGVAANILATDMRLNMALPCRISVYTENGKTKIGLIKPLPMFSVLSQDAGLTEVIRDVEKVISDIVDEAR